MTSVFKVRDEFSCAAHYDLIVQNYRLLIETFPERAVELFYYVKPMERDAFFIVRIKKAGREKFIEAMRRFAENMNFTALDNKEVKVFLFRTEPLDDYV